MLCPRCNTNNPDGSTFCSGCGLTLIDSEKAQANISESYNAYGSTTPQTTQSYYDNQPYSSFNAPPQYPVQNPAPYQQNMINYPPYQDPYAEHVSVLQWIGLFCLNLIPGIGSLVYLIFMFVWAFSNTPKRSLKTFAQAQLIIAGIVIVILILIRGISGLTIEELLDSI